MHPKTKTTKIDNYCSQKFWWLSVEPERGTMMSCCSASANKIDTTWLKSNPGQLFNSPGLLRDREQMLNGERVDNCSSCWQAEDLGIPSRRTVMQSDEVTHTDLYNSPKILHITLSSDCNLTCSYCCKQYSTAWLRDINNNGVYFDEPRYTINTNDRILLKLGQKTLKQSRPYNEILDEVKQYKNCEQVVLTGGETFLYNGLTELASSFDSPVDIFTGLGVDSQRLARILNQLPGHVKITVSAENMGKLYEFNRHGNTWDNFQRNLDLLANRNYRFCSVISNTTVQGYAEFERTYGTVDDQLNICNDPDYLGPNVLDTASKQLSISNPTILSAINAEPTPEQHAKAKQYIKEFARRRNLSLDIFPDSFQAWINE